MLRSRVTFFAATLACLSLAGGCRSGAGGGSPWWKFWASREDVRENLFSVDIPSPPEVVMPTAPLRTLPPPETSAGEDEKEMVKRVPVEAIIPALRSGYFDFDSVRLTEEAKEILRQNAKWLQEHPDKEVQIQGHCDERGTVEYNFNLGQRRAEVVKSFLMDLGVSPDRIQTISYGEERPAVPGHDEESWQLNRRAEFHAY